MQDNDTGDTDDVLDIHVANQVIDTCVWRSRRFDPPEHLVNQLICAYTIAIFPEVCYNVYAGQCCTIYKSI